MFGPPPQPRRLPTALCALEEVLGEARLTIATVGVLLAVARA